MIEGPDGRFGDTPEPGDDVDGSCQGELTGFDDAVSSAEGTDGRLVRLPASDTRWAARLPRVPQGLVTVSVGDPVLARVPADDLVGGGYRIVGSLEGGAFIDLLVPADLVRVHPSWFRELTARDDVRVFHLAHGPVQALFRDVLSLHRAARPAGCPG